MESRALVRVTATGSVTKGNTNLTMIAIMKKAAQTITFTDGDGGATKFVLDTDAELVMDRLKIHFENGIYVTISGGSPEIMIGYN